MVRRRSSLDVFRGFLYWLAKRQGRRREGCWGSGFGEL
jgi:hypothetical protein